MQKALVLLLIPSPVSNKTNEKELFLPITGELSKFITCSICLPNNEYWYKTDKIDCSIISRYVSNTDMRVTPLKVSNVDFLRQKLSRRNQLVEMAKIQKTQAHQVTDISIIKQMKELLAILQNQIQVLEDEMIELIQQSQELKKNTYQ